MPFWYAAFLSMVCTYCLYYIVTTWESIFKIEIPGLCFIISIPVAWIAITLFIYYSPEKILRPVMVAGSILVFLSIFANKISEWIKKQ